MPVRHFPVLERKAEVVAPGVIVSTVVDADGAHTVVFTRDRRERLGFRTEVTWHDSAWRQSHDDVAVVARAEAHARAAAAPGPHPKQAVAR